MKTTEQEKELIAKIASAKRMETEDVTICEYCGKEKQGLSFMIGASTQPDWTMIYGTGKMTCPDCYDKAMDEGRDAVSKHIRGTK